MDGSRLAITMPWVSPMPAPTNSVNWVNSAGTPANRGGGVTTSGSATATAPLPWPLPPTRFITSCITLVISSSSIGHSSRWFPTRSLCGLHCGFQYSGKALRQDFLDICVGPGDDVNRYHLTHLLSSSSASIGRRLDCADIATDHRRD